MKIREISTRRRDLPGEQNTTGDPPVNEEAGQARMCKLNLLSGEGTRGGGRHIILKDVRPGH